MAKKKRVKTATQRRAKETVEAILKAAAQVLVREGYAHATTNKIAERAGVSIGSIYQYFPNKDALISELVERQSACDMAFLSKMLEDLSTAPIQHLAKRLSQASIELFKIDRPLRQILHEQVPRTSMAKGNTTRTRTTFSELLSPVLKAHLVSQKRDVKIVSFIVVHAFLGSLYAAGIEGDSFFLNPAFVNELERLALSYIGSRQ